MSIENCLWTALAVNAALYFWIGRSVISQPSWRRPAIFWSQGMLLIAAIFPISVFLLITVAGFYFTIKGSHFLALSIAIYCFFAVKPRLDE